jgi:magnesium transporter
LRHCISIPEEKNLTDTSHRQELDDLQARLRELLRLHLDAQSGGEAARASGAAPEAYLGELRSRLEALHPADVAFVLEALPPDGRLIVWDLVKAERDGEILLEVSDAVRETLIESMDSEELVAATEQLDTDEIADLAPTCPMTSSKTCSSRCRRKSASSCARPCPIRRIRWAP